MDMFGRKTPSIRKSLLIFAVLMSAASIFAFAVPQDVAALSAPGQVKWSSAVKTSSTITLKWKKVSKARGYSVYQRKGGKYIKIRNTGKISCRVINLKAYTSYKFYVKAYKTAYGRRLYGKRSVIKTVRTKAVPISSVTVADRTAASGSTATFNAEVKGGTSPYAYQWYKKTPENAGFIKITGANAPSYSPQTGSTGKVTMHNNGTQYKCIAGNAAGFAEDAGTLMITGVSVTGSWSIGNTAGLPVNYNGSNGSGSVVATLYSDGELAVTGTGDTLTFGSASSGSGAWTAPWCTGTAKDSVRYSTIENSVKVTDMTFWYYECKVLIYSSEIPSSVKKMNYTFYDCTSLTESPKIPSAVTDMEGTFYNCTALTGAPDMTGADSVSNMYGTFLGCEALQKAPDIPNSVTSMKATFSRCTSLLTAPELPDRLTTMEGAFVDCTSLKSAPLIPSSVTNTKSAFNSCSSLTKASAIPSSVTNMSSMYWGCTALLNAPVIPEKMENMDSAFYFCLSLTKAPDIPASVKHMYNTFAGCSKLAGTMIIYADPDSYDYCFDGAASDGSELKIYGSLSSANEGAVKNLVNTKGSSSNIIFGGLR